jgi:hypothetical protein
MLLTKEYFKKRQLITVVACIFVAGIIGSIQSAFIIKLINKEK